MGLSSSQGRLLMLTSRLSDIELNEVLISQKQSQLARQSEKAAKEYQDAISNYKITVKVSDTTGESSSGYNIEDLSYSSLADAGYLVHNSDGEIYLMPIKDEEGNITGYQQAFDVSGSPLTQVPEYNEEKQQWEVKVGTDPEAASRKVIDITNYVNNNKALQNSIINGTLFLYNVADGQPGISTANLPTETKLEYVVDTSDDAQAESKYEYEVARIARQDNMLDLEMQQLETQHEAVLKEYESVKKVISNNIDRTFKIFSDG
jgi:hypothetical protein